jgi:peptide/nickel transport system permease protein
MSDVAESAWPNAAAAPPARRGAWTRFRKHRMATVGLVAIALLVLTSYCAPFVFNLDPYGVNLRAYRKPPSSDHWLGTDAAGRDVLSRLIYAGRVSLSVGVVAVGIYTAIGVTLGALAGFYGKKVDGFIMRLADIVMAFPSLLFIITVASIVGPSIYNIMVIIGLLGWPPVARLVRGMILSIREREYVASARAIGAPNRRIIFRHILPNVMAPVLVTATFGAANAILLEAGLSFIGLGVQSPTASLGNMLEAAQSLTILDSMPWLWVPPGLTIAVTVLSLNFIGDGVRDALDPRQVKS